ncbi:glycosyltransferase family 4 protein [Sphingopyxis sp. EG6]|uniref:glycosyltransferase family 4 protein n=1 Tax=Sphingopyxis sp. EG6 TaxID=1874061 RepID=UPI000DC62BA8|nr:glycosyltransferase family 4 protein [Sphingopyxis sp. EG6]BBB08631.1 glycosyl transferase [Sphingopyxis sp. EG6]
MIIHFTTVHPRDDSRIRSKEVSSLARQFGDVSLYVQDGLGDEIDVADGYRIVDTGPRLRRIARMTLGGWRMFRAVARARPKVAHFHDPELLPWAILLRLYGIKVVYDVHEDVPRQVRFNPTLPVIARRFLPPFVSLAEWIGARLINGLIVPTTTIMNRFPPSKTALVRNYPMLEELHTPNATPMRERPLEIAYVGYISEGRNISGMMKAAARLPYPEARLRLVGEFAIAEMEQSARAMPEWQSVRFDGWASRQEVADVLGNVRGGLVVIKPIAYEMLTLPIKLFEYMAAGLPVIATDCPLWRSIVESAGCGLLVDPLDVDAMAAAMTWIIEHPEDAQAMGERGRFAVEAEYNWDRESATLIGFYRRQLGVGGIS